MTDRRRGKSRTGTTRSPHPVPASADRPLVYLEYTPQWDAPVSSVHEPLRFEFSLYSDILPKTCANFKSLCGVGSVSVPAGRSKASGGKPIQYLGTTVHQYEPGFMFAGGDMAIHGAGRQESIYGQAFDDEGFFVSHNGPGVLTMANSGPNSNGSIFCVTLAEAPWLDGSHVAFGRLVSGLAALQRVEALLSSDNPPTLVVTSCGVIENG